jgi:hypothetical protein
MGKCLTCKLENAQNCAAFFKTVFVKNFRAMFSSIIIKLFDRFKQTHSLFETFARNTAHQENNLVPIGLIR